MADELTVQLLVDFLKGKNSLKKDFGKVLTDVTGTKPHHTVQTIGTTEEPIDFGDITPAGVMLMLYNLDETNFIEVQADTTLQATMKLLANDFPQIIRVADGATPQAVADTADCDLAIWVVEA